MDGPLTIIAYSDYVCPWCYIALQRIEQLEQEFPVRVEWRGFELHPETPRAGTNQIQNEASRSSENAGERPRDEDAREEDSGERPRDEDAREEDSGERPRDGARRDENPAESPRDEDVGDENSAEPPRDGAGRDERAAEPAHDGAGRDESEARSGAHLIGRLGSSARVRAYRDNILALAEESGLAMRMPMVVANSHLALEAAEQVRNSASNEVFRAFHRALFQAYFERGMDLGDAEVLCAIAHQCGADDQGLRQTLADGTYARFIDDATAAAREDEILSTPTFLYESGFRLTGAQDYAVFRSITQRLLSLRAAEKDS